MNHDNRVFGLDLLRAFAVLFVVYGHGYYLVERTAIAGVYNLPVFDGVSIFFVLSGFLIGRILLRAVAKENFNKNMLMDFWVRRWFRTLPNYFFILCFLSLAAIFGYYEENKNIIYYFIFSQNIASPHPNFFPEAWSLAVEEWFYLFAPIPLYIAAKVGSLSRQRVMLVWIVAVIVFTTAFRVYRAYYFEYSDVGEWDLNLRKQVVTRIDSLMFGVLGAYLSLYYKDSWNRFSSPAVFVGVGFLFLDKALRLYMDSMFYTNYFSLSVTAIGTLFLLPKLSVWRTVGSKAIVSLVTFVSLTSYSMYLLNFSPVQGVILPIVMDEVMHYLWRLDEYRAIIAYGLYWVLTVGLSYFVFRFFEKPMTSLRDKCGSHEQPSVKAFSEDGK